jgi:hypothetical protein
MKRCPRKRAGQRRLHKLLQIHRRVRIFARTLDEPVGPERLTPPMGGTDNLIMIIMIRFIVGTCRRRR